jgi:Arc-like DNA binding domain
MTMAKNTKDTSHLRVRIDPIRLAKLEKAAERNHRTLTGEIVHRLDQSFKSDDLTDVLERLSDRVTVKITEVLKTGRSPKRDES